MMVAPYRRSSLRRSSVALAGMTHVGGQRFSWAISASEMPVFPLVGSSSSRPGCNSPDASAASIIALATRSLIEPVGFSPSSFAYMRTDGFGVSRLSSTSGVLPTSERRLSATSGLGTAGHGREQDHRRAKRNRCLEAVECAHVLALDVDVHERGDIVVLHELRAQTGKAGHQVVE